MIDTVIGSLSRFSMNSRPPVASGLSNAHPARSPAVSTDPRRTVSRRETTLLMCTFLPGREKGGSGQRIDTIGSASVPRPRDSPRATFLRLRVPGGDVQSNASQYPWVAGLVGASS
jgi:hypothetical protein